MYLTDEDRELIDEVITLFSFVTPLTPEQQLQYKAAVTICHTTVCRLRLREMIEGELHHLAHDVGGIRRYLALDANGARLTECFRPRWAAR
jgi:hypothetical protein